MKQLRSRIIVALVLLITATFPAHASEPVNGSFTAGKSCELYSSFNKQSNPGAVHAVVGKSYAVKEINKPGDYAWLRVDVDGANPNLRWVARDCGTAQLDQVPQDNPPAGRAKANREADRQTMCSTPNLEDSYVLAITWQPGFCEHFAYRGKKPECDAINSGKLKINNLTLHGLWPNKKECGINYGSCSTEPMKLSSDTIKRIAKWMPNFQFESKFGEYEWSKHGTCQARDADTYFKTAAAAVEEVNNSAVGKFILDHAGKSFAVKDFFEMLKKQEGEKIAQNFMLSCADGKYLQEIRLKLPTNFETGKGLTKLIGDAEGFNRQTDKCDNEIIVETSGRGR
ncbi:ribonuclease T2 family protein [Undibacterium sp. TC4M20W]|uniref:ribonuclease T2 family protein n=1 Tax=unclassified Undibacterium TaxID=2630295 RepID=UPI003BF0F830